MSQIPPTQIGSGTTGLSQKDRSPSLVELRVDSIAHEHENETVPPEAKSDSWAWQILSYCGNISSSLFWSALGYSSRTPVDEEPLIDPTDESLGFTLVDYDPAQPGIWGRLGRICLAAGSFAYAPVTAIRSIVSTEMPSWYDHQHRMALETVRQHCLNQSELRFLMQPGNMELTSFQNAVREAATKLSNPLGASAWDEHSNFIYHLRQACRQWQACPEAAAETPESSLLDEMIQARFLGNHIHPFCNELLTLFRDQGFPEVKEQYQIDFSTELQRAMPIERRLWLFYLAVYHGPQSLKGSPLQQGYESFCGEFNYYFDPHRWGSNLPNVLFNLNIEQKNGELKTIPCVRMGTPTQQIDASMPNAAQAKPIDEFRHFIDSYARQGKSHLYFNFQNLVPKKRHGDESQRCAAIKSLAKDYPETLKLVTLSKNSLFYEQKEPFNTKLHHSVFLELLEKDLLQDPRSGLYLAKELTSDYTETWIRGRMEAVLQESFAGLEYLDASQRITYVQKLMAEIRKQYIQSQATEDSPAHFASLPDSSGYVLQQPPFDKDEHPGGFMETLIYRVFDDENSEYFLSDSLKTDELRRWAKQTLEKIHEEEFYQKERVSRKERTEWIRSFNDLLAEHLKEMEHESGLAILSFNPDSQYYTDSPLYSETLHAKHFFKAFQHQLYDAPMSGYDFPDEFRTKEARQDSERIMHEIWADVFDCNPSLNQEERRDFIEIFYTRLMRHLIAKSGVDSYSAICKDDIDRGAAASALFYWYQQLLEGTTENLDVQDNLIIFTLAPALLVRQRQIIGHRLTRMINAIKRLALSETTVENLRKRHRGDALKDIWVKNNHKQGLASNCKDARSLPEYRKCLETAISFDIPELLPGLVDDLLNDESLHRKTVPIALAGRKTPLAVHKQFFDDLERQAITINKRSYNKGSPEDKCRSAYVALHAALGKGSKEVAKQMTSIGNQTLANWLLEFLHLKLFNVDLQIQVQQAVGDFPPYLVNYTASEDKRLIHTLGVYKVFCMDDDLLRGAERMGKPFPPIYIKASLEIDLNNPQKTSAVFSMLPSTQAGTQSDDGRLNDMESTFSEFWSIIDEGVALETDVTGR